MERDGAASQHRAAEFMVWTKYLIDNKTDLLAAKLAVEHCKKPPTASTFYKQGYFNRSYKVQLKDGPDVLVRFPVLGRSMFRREELEDETLVMQFLDGHTSIPVPRVFGAGMSPVGPYTVVEFISGKPLSDYLQAERDGVQTEVLNPTVDSTVLQRAYSSIVKILLELNDCRFPWIGSLCIDDSRRFKINKRAMTLNMNELVEQGNFPPQRFSQQCYTNPTKYFVSLADDHLNHLETQRNNAFTDEDDCRKKYIARCLFRKIAKSFSTADRSPRLFPESLHPSQVIVDENLNVRGVVDWKFTYAAPVEFVGCSPWWLLLTRPASWDGGLDDFIAKYIPRQKLFLETLRTCEEEMIQSGVTLRSPYLSDQMAESVENGNFWFYLAATSSYIFDDVYWKFIHPKYYSDFSSITDLIKLLSEEEQAKIEPFVRMKMDKADGTFEEQRPLGEMLTA